MARVINFRLALENMTDEERRELEAEGYDLESVEASVSGFMRQHQKWATLRGAVNSMPVNVKEALEEIVIGLTADSTPDYRSACQHAFMRLMSMDTYNFDDVSLTRKILGLGAPKK